jgi:hypothetical protein
MTWNWRPIGVPTSLGVEPSGGLPPAGTTRIAVTSGGLVHLLVEGSEQLQHFTIDRDGALQAMPDLPLSTLSSAVAAGSGFAVAGAALGDHRPSVCRVDGSGDARPIDVPSTFESGQAAPVAAWPKLAFSGDLWVVWSVGRERAEIRCATVSDGKLHDIGTPLPATFVLDLQVARGADSVVVLWQDADGIHLRHEPAGSGKMIVAPKFSGKSRVVDGLLLTPRPEHRIEVQEIESGAVHELQLPPPPDGDNAEIVWAGTIIEPDGISKYLAWTTQTGAEDLGDPPGLSARSRSRIAPVNGNWRPGPANEVPAFSQCYAALGDRVFAFPVAGPVLGWWSTPT